MSKLTKWIRKNPTFRAKAVSIFQKLYILFSQKIMSDKVKIIGKPNFLTPMILKGKGEFKFAEGNTFGGETSPNFYIPGYMEARNSETVIEFGERFFSNNNLTIIAEGENEKGGVKIGNDVMFGFNVTIIDSNFHDINPLKRRATKQWGGGIKTAKVIIGNNCWIGSNSLILKGVQLGDNSIVGAGSVVTKSFPENVIIAGNPAKITGTLDRFFQEKQDEKMDNSICKL